MLFPAVCFTSLVCLSWIEILACLCLYTSLFLLFYSNMILGISMIKKRGMKVLELALCNSENCNYSKLLNINWQRRWLVSVSHSAGSSNSFYRSWKIATQTQIFVMWLRYVGEKKKTKQSILSLSPHVPFSTKWNLILATTRESNSDESAIMV